MLCTLCHKNVDIDKPNFVHVKREDSHQFHLPCIQKYFLTNNDCPTCNNVIPLSDRLKALSTFNKVVWLGRNIVALTIQLFVTGVFMFTLNISSKILNHSFVGAFAFGYMCIVMGMMLTLFSKEIAKKFNSELEEGGKYLGNFISTFGGLNAHSMNSSLTLGTVLGAFSGSMCMDLMTNEPKPYKNLYGLTQGAVIKRITGLFHINEIKLIAIELFIFNCSLIHYYITDLD